MRKFGAIATAVSAALGLMAAGKASAETACPFNYAKFEFIVPHIDVHDCPDPTVKPGAFCRASTGSDHVHVFYFDSEGDQCLLKIDTFPEEAFTLSFKK